MIRSNGGGGGGAGVASAGMGGASGCSGDDGCIYPDEVIMEKGVAFNVRVSIVVINVFSTISTLHNCPPAPRIHFVGRWGCG